MIDRKNAEKNSTPIPNIELDSKSELELKSRTYLTLIKIYLPKVYHSQSIPTKISKICAFLKNKLLQSKETKITIIKTSINNNEKHSEKHKSKSRRKRSDRSHDTISNYKI